ncbi:MAG TPA: thiamine pyrophosphate-binding protein, partial [Solirubrobacteraceae bacterium]|nr:thiamine pyrophosphate-binding protein [Solirubrobacteraceae bacterium]
AHTPAADPGWLGAWRVADDAAATAIGRVLGDDALSEPLVARVLAARLPPDATLFVASSMPVRDIESFMAVRDDAPRVLSNRGANGIDGTISSAFGAAAVASGPVVLLIGDVALAHDVGGLLAARRLGLALTIVVLDNDGGGIFEFLPIAAARDAFEEHVATPHGLDFAHAAALYGCAYADVGDRAALDDALEGALASDATTIIRVASDRAANVALHRELQAAVAAALAV